MAKKKKNITKKIKFDKDKAVKTTKKLGRVLWVVVGVVLAVAFVITFISFMKLLTGDIKIFFESLGRLFN